MLTVQVESLAALKQRDIISGWVFHRADGSRIKDVRKRWKTASTDAGYPGALFHDFRRTAARNSIRAGVPEKQAMAITGHKTRSVF